VVITESENIETFHMLQCYYALKIEVRTGLRHSRGSILALVRERYGITSKTKAKAMTELAALLKDRGHEVK